MTIFSRKKYFFLILVITLLGPGYGLMAGQKEVPQNLTKQELPSPK